LVVQNLAPCTRRVDEGDNPQLSVTEQTGQREGYTDACRGTTAGTGFAQTAFHHAQKDTQDGALRGRITAQEIAPPLGYSQHPLAHRQAWKDVIGQMRSRHDHDGRRRSEVCSCASDGSRAGDA
jgi:hypothetical protein